MHYGQLRSIHSPLANLVTGPSTCVMFKKLLVSLEPASENNKSYVCLVQRSYKGTSCLPLVIAWNNIFTTYWLSQLSDMNILYNNGNVVPYDQLLQEGYKLRHIITPIIRLWIQISPRSLIFMWLSVQLAHYHPATYN